MTRKKIRAKNHAKLPTKKNGETQVVKERKRLNQALG